MTRAFAILICIAATYSLYVTAAELGIYWYSGSEDQITAHVWINIGVSTFVDVAALAMAWQLARRRRGTAATATNG